MRLVRVFPNLTFTHGTNVLAAPDGTNRIFVTEQTGRVLVFPNDQQVRQASVFLDIQDQVNTLSNEEGLLGLAFDPEFKTNGLFYVYYSAANPRRNVLARFAVSRDSRDQADLASRLIILELPKPFGNHNGGQLAFGADGMLYVSVGDGGGNNYASGQDASDLLGNILRIDVRGATPSAPYRLPSDNPFLTRSSIRGEVWAYGLRNPWRFAFDPATGLMWAADAGQAGWEEVNVVKKGGNYGWAVMEGPDCYIPATGCNKAGLELPVAQYRTSEGCTIIGGHVVRDPQALPPLQGAYIYGDHCAGKVWGLRYDGSAVTEQRLLVEDDRVQITSFGALPGGLVVVLSRDKGLYALTE